MSINLSNKRRHDESFKNYTCDHDNVRVKRSKDLNFSKNWHPETMPPNTTDIKKCLNKKYGTRNTESIYAGNLYEVRISN